MLIPTTEELIEQFENGTLPAEAFRHGDHVRMAFEYFRLFPLLEVLERFPAALTRFAAKHGKPGLYHETITWAFLLLIRERMARMAGKGTWEEFAAANADLLSKKETVLKKYYSDETLSSTLARGTFLLPDRILPRD